MKFFSDTTLEHIRNGYEGNVDYSKRANMFEICSKFAVLFRSYQKAVDSSKRTEKLP